MALDFNGRVAVVTGAGGGLGREYALLLAARGASVVVNDLGGARDGSGGGVASPADKVVGEINAKGGNAVANYDSVEDGERIVATAIDAFGRIDILINNAGILRDKSFKNMSEQDWDLVHKVHMKGAFQVTKAAWPHMVKQNYGRIVFTSSAAGLFGNFGQANYSSAKAGLVGLSHTLSAEGRKYNVHSNVVAPLAASRLTIGTLPPDVLDKFTPEKVAPVVAWLSHEDCADSGLVVETAGGWAGRYRLHRNEGAVLDCSPDGGVPTIEQVRDKWDQVTDWPEGEVRCVASSYEAVSTVSERIESAAANFAQQRRGFSSDASPPSDSEGDGQLSTSAVGFESAWEDYSVSTRDVILYALGVGASLDSANGIRYLYEGHVDFAALPTFGVLPAMEALPHLVSGKVPGLSIDLSKVLHGEQYTERLSPMPVDGRLTSSFKVSAVLDKRHAGGVVVLDAVTKSKETGKEVVRNQMNIFVVGAGGFGGPRSSDVLIATKKSPGGTPDAVAEYKTSIDQAALYRLSGDKNPLHIDPDFAALGGFATPILHGLCSYGVAARQITEVLAGGDPSRVRKVKARFSKPVLPGQTLVTKMWLSDDDLVLFNTSVKETGAECLSGGWAEVEGLGNGKAKL